MGNKEGISKQQDLYKCDCCEDYSPTHYDLDIVVDFEDEATKDEVGWREWPYRLCRHCYYKWYEGRMSTKELILLCNHNLDKRSHKT